MEQRIRTALTRTLALAALISHAVCAFAYDTSYLQSDPALLARLQEWEARAPEAVRREVRSLQPCNTVAAIEAAGRLQRLGAAAKGATLALVDCLGSGGPVGMFYDKKTGMPMGPPTASIASVSAGALGAIGPAIVEVLAYAVALPNKAAAQSANSLLTNTLVSNKRLIPRAAEILAQLIGDADAKTRKRVVASFYWQKGYGTMPDSLVQALARAMSDDDRLIAEASLGWLMNVRQQPNAAAAIALAPQRVDLCKSDPNYMSGWKWHVFDLAEPLRRAVAQNLRSTESTVRARTECLILKLNDARFASAIDEVIAAEADETARLPLAQLRERVAMLPARH